MNTVFSTAYEQSISLPFELPTPVYGAMLGIWQMRPWLQRRFPLQHGNRTIYLKFLAWCALHGRREYPVLREIKEWDTYLDRPAGLPEINGDNVGDMFTTGMCLLGFARYDEYFWPILCSAGARKGFWRWYWRSLRVEMALSVPDWQRQQLVACYRNSLQNFLLDIVPLVERKMLRRASKRLVDKYALHDIFLPDSLECIKNPCEEDIELISEEERVNNFTDDLLSPAEEGFRDLLKWVPVWPHRLLRLREVAGNRCPTTDEEISVMGQIPMHRGSRAKIRFPIGVNLIGYGRGELGQGEDLRMMSLTLELANIPHCVVNVRPGNNISQKDDGVDHLMSEAPRFAINILCMTGIESLRFYLQSSREVFDGRYTIGLWPWELPDWPAHWRHVYSLVDEIWGISEFTSQAYQDAPVPVSTVPLPVSVEALAERTRRDFGLPEDDYLFIFSFDLASTLTRKNPVGVIEAFMQAFPGNREGPSVGLVLKVNNVDRVNMQWRSLKRKIAGDPRIKVIEKSLRRPEVLALYKCCDCFVSLHRAEGFGRSIVESLMLGLDVIATAYSGNMDYADAPGLYLVDYDICPLVDGDYFLAQGQSWAEPSIANAAGVMRQLGNRRKSARSKAYYERYQPGKVSAFYREKLQDIFEKTQ